jgi:hypothetical protein
MRIVQNVKQFPGLRLQRRTLVFFVILLLMRSAFALQTSERLWVGAMVEKPLIPDRQWSYLIFTQLRYINQSQAWQSALLEGALGYYLTPRQSLWFGYRYSLLTPPDGYRPENRLWQQMTWVAVMNDHNTVILRNRIEETKYAYQSQISVRLRERLLVEWWQHYFGALNPLVYDEVFFQLSKTNYTSSRLINQNRLFLGVNVRASTDHFWEVGYINQYLMRTPQQTQNSMNHIISITYMEL